MYIYIYVQNGILHLPMMFSPHLSQGASTKAHCSGPLPPEGAWLSASHKYLGQNSTVKTGYNLKFDQLDTSQS